MNPKIILLLIAFVQFTPNYSMVAADMITIVSGDGKEISISRAKALEIGQFKDLLQTQFAENRQNKIEFRDLNSTNLNQLKNFIENKQIQDPITALRLADQLDYPLLKQDAKAKIEEQLNQKQISSDTLKSRLAGTNLLEDIAKLHFLKHEQIIPGIDEQILRFTFKDYQQNKPYEFFRFRTTKAFGKQFDFSALYLGNLDGLDKLANLSQAETLALYGNKLSELSPSTIPAIASLKTLTLNNNRIDSIAPGTFRGFPALVYLQLSGNPLKTLASGTFEGLNNLTDLFLSKAQLHSLSDDIFQQTPALQRIMLNDNKLTQLSTNVFRGLTQLKTVNLIGNTLSETNKKELKNAYPNVKFIF
jgi:Leucine-rich repeat (LRR) protein